MEINIGIIAIIVLAIAILAILASGYVKASPNKAYIISGIKREPKVLIGVVQASRFLFWRRRMS